MDCEKIINRLIKINESLEELKRLNYKEGRNKYYSFDSEVRMIVRRIYPNYQEVERRIFSPKFGVAHHNEVWHQEEFITDLDDLIRTWLSSN